MELLIEYHCTSCDAVSQSAILIHDNTVSANAVIAACPDGWDVNRQRCKACAERIMNDAIKAADELGKTYAQDMEQVYSIFTKSHKPKGED